LVNQARSHPEDNPYGLRLAALDPAALVESFAAVGLELARRPQVLAKEATRLALDEGEVVLDAARAALGEDGERLGAREAEDQRFADRAWKDNPFLRLALGSYVASSRSARRLLDEARVPELTRRKARFLLDLWLDAVAPSNVPWLNPRVVKEAVDTGGLSLVRGFANFVHDAAASGGLPSQVDQDAFELGRNLAATPGRVVFRNDLIELLAYEPQTATVFAEPIVYNPPWINKYYVLDLAPGRSFVEHAVREGFTVFAISYRNPDASMAELTMDDYLRDGVMAALDRASELTGSSRVNLLGVCLGGTFTAIALGALAARGEAGRIGWAALLNTLVDFADPGEIGVFTDEATIERIERRMSRRGYLDPSELSGPFTWMRANDLVWRYVVSSWYLGKRPPPFDILAWNADSTRLPAVMHSQYLRACYLRNLLVQPGAFVLDGTPVDLGSVETPLFVLGAEADHIAPWRSTYRTTQLVSGEVRYALGSGGHIAGMVSPPGSPKAFHLRRPDSPPTPDAWLEGAERVQGSWWAEWAAWAAARSGERVAPPDLPAGEPAPGSYVRG
jgi:poly[(R)-3-hydroxyalkanoate] polymerase subunit PhaC